MGGQLDSDVGGSQDLLGVWDHTAARFTFCGGIRKEVEETSSALQSCDSWLVS